MHRLCQGAARQKYTPWVVYCSKRPDLVKVQIRKSFFSTCKRFLKDGNDDHKPVAVRWYEQLFPGSVERRPIDPDEIGDDGTVKELKSRIARLEEELEELQRGKSLGHISLEDEEQVEETVEQQTNLSTLIKEDAVTNPPSSVRQQDDLEIKLHLPIEQDIYLRNLNKSLRNAATNISSSIARKELWKWYVRCKQSLPPFLSLIPDVSWDVLWESQYRVVKSHQDRATHLRRLLEDMLQGRRELTVSQRLVFIDLLQQEDRHEEAIKKWEIEEVDLRANKDTCWEFEELGVQLYASGGYPQKAQDLAVGILTRDDSKKARLLIPVIMAWAQRGDDTSLKNAWTLYIHLKERLGSDIGVEDYDKIAIGFLSARRTDIGLAVFKDMMLIGKASGYESTELYRASLGLVNTLQSQSVDSASLTKVSLTALTILPRKFQNKFFYASWMKKLLGMGEVDAAASVVELMYQRGVKPDPKHLNGIVGAWLRDGSDKSKEKAIQMGWAMIHERVEFVRRRQENAGKDQADTTLSVLQEPRIHVPPYLQRTVPQATIETFSLLLLYYGRRSMMSNIEQLLRHMSIAEISPNSYFMNHLLYVELRHGNYRGSIKIYRNMSQTVRPDLETFACLWDCQKAHLERPSFNASDGFPDTRSVFCDMITVITKMSKRERDAAQEAFNQELYNQIIRCMCLAGDVEGIITSLYALKHYFLFLPDENIARLVTLQVARMGNDKPKLTKRRRNRLSDNPQNKVNVIKVAKVLKFLIDQRNQELKERGINREEFDHGQQADELLFILAKFLRLILERTASSEKPVDEMIEQAAWEMGVGGIRMEDPMLKK